MNNKSYLRFEFIDDSGYRTLVEKEWENQSSTLGELMLEVRSCLIACGFSEHLVNEYIPNDVS